MNNLNTNTNTNTNTKSISGQKKSEHSFKSMVKMVGWAILGLLISAYVIFINDAQATSTTQWVVAKQALSSLVVDTAQSQRHIFKVEIADTPKEHAQGLMGRMTLSPNYGMVFLFDGTRPVKMWMKNTYVSLDMFFIDSTGNIIFIQESAVPFSTNQVGPDVPVQAVLELPAGTASTLEIKVGDRVYLQPNGAVRY